MERNQHSTRDDFAFVRDVLSEELRCIEPISVAIGESCGECPPCMARSALRDIEEQLEALDEKPDQPLLNAARRLVKATDNAERNYALADLVVALERDSNPATRRGDTTAEEMREWNAHIEETWLSESGSSPARES